MPARLHQSNQTVGFFNSNPLQKMKKLVNLPRYTWHFIMVLGIVLILTALFCGNAKAAETGTSPTRAPNGILTSGYFAWETVPLLAGTEEKAAAPQPWWARFSATIEVGFVSMSIAEDSGPRGRKPAQVTSFTFADNGKLFNLFEGTYFEFKRSQPLGGGTIRSDPFTYYQSFLVGTSFKFGLIDVEVAGGYTMLPTLREMVLVKVGKKTFNHTEIMNFSYWSADLALSHTWKPTTGVLTGHNIKAYVEGIYFLQAHGSNVGGGVSGIVGLKDSFTLGASKRWTVDVGISGSIDDGIIGLKSGAKVVYLDVELSYKLSDRSKIVASAKAYHGWFPKGDERGQASTGVAFGLRYSYTFGKLGED